MPRSTPTSTSSRCGRPASPGIVERALCAGAGFASGALGRAASRSLRLCPGAPDLQILCRGCGVLESAIVDPRGRLFFTSQTWAGQGQGALLRMDDPRSTPVAVSLGIDSPGGLAFAPDGRLLVGFGDSLKGGVSGNFAGRAGLWLVDPDSGRRELWVTGLGMANGVARAPDGTVFASNDLGIAIDRISADGRVEPGWVHVCSANGLAVDAAGRYLYAAQTFTRAAIKRIEIAHPDNAGTHAQPPLGACASALDGLTIDDRDQLYVAANGAGQIWRIDADGSICILARGLRCPSSVALGRGSTGFHAGNLYAVTFCGEVAELENVV